MTGEWSAQPRGKPSSFAFRLNNDGSLEWGIGGGGTKKGKGNWSRSGDRLTLHLTLGGGPLPGSPWELKLQETDNNHFTGTHDTGEVLDWTRQ